MVRGIFVSLLLLGLTSTTAMAADMATWNAATQARCPTRHLDWMCDGCYDDFLAGFEKNLAPETQAKIVEIADYSHRCVKEVGGFSCEMSVHVDALKRLGLLKRFVAWGCAHYRCEEAAACSRTGSSRAGR